MTILDNLQQKLEELIKDKNIPGASVTVYQNGTFTQAIAGVINMNTQQPVIPETVFMIGSVTKVLTATLLMQLVDEGEVELNDPANKYLPEVKIGTEDLPDDITVAMLLNHTSGIDGDFFIETGKNDDALEKYIARLTEVEFMHPAGKMRAYNNATYNMVGRIIEKKRNKTFHEVLRENLLQPVGITDDVLSYPEILKYSAAVGHSPDPKDNSLSLADPTIAHYGEMPMGGGLIIMSSLSLAKLGQFYLNNGVTTGGKRLVSPKSLNHMKAPLEGLVNTANAQVWDAFSGSGMKLFNHFGGTSGQNSWLGILPEKDLAIAVLTNSFTGAFEILENLLPEIFKELGDFEMDKPSEDPDAAKSIKIDHDKYVGSYTRYSMDIDIKKDEHGTLWIKSFDREDELNLGAKDWYELKPTSESSFEILEQTLAPITLTVAFFDFKETEYPVLIFFGRPHKRVR